MPNGHEFGAINNSQGICGFTSTLYAVYEHMPSVGGQLDAAAGDARTRLMAEIKTFLVMLKAYGKQSLLDEIETLTKTFPKYEGWTIEKYIQSINNAARPDGVDTPNINFSIAMPPKPLVEYLRMVWGFVPFIENSLTDKVENSILGLTRTGAPENTHGNLAHYVYKNSKGKILSWGEEFTSIADMNQKREKDYSIVSRISLNC